MNVVIGVEGNSSRDCVHLAHVGPAGRREAVLRRGDVVPMPVDGRVEVVSATHGEQDMEPVLLLPVLTRGERARWQPVPTDAPEPEGGCTAA